MTPMLRLYDTITSGNGYKVRWLLMRLGLPFERVELDIDRGETRTPAFLAMNPNGRVPLLQIALPVHLLIERQASEELCRGLRASQFRDHVQHERRLQQLVLAAMHLGHRAFWKVQ